MVGAHHSQLLLPLGVGQPDSDEETVDGRLREQEGARALLRFALLAQERLVQGYVVPSTVTGSPRGLE
jgi:hypothetical protein